VAKVNQGVIEEAQWREGLQNALTCGSDRALIELRQAAVLSRHTEVDLVAD
jgi:hypothetical protein